MAKKPAQDEFNLFDVIEKEEAKDKPESCSHRREIPTLTVWEGETCQRMTWTCEFCGRIRGRMP